MQIKTYTKRDIAKIVGKRLDISIRKSVIYTDEVFKAVKELLSGIDFRAKNLESFDSLESSSIDLYASIRSLYLQDRQRKIKNIDEDTETMNDDDWEEID